MLLNIHKNHDGKKITVICDESLKGKCFEEEEKLLDLNCRFYNGEKADEETIMHHIKTSYLVNAVGEKTIAFLESKKLVSKESVKKICNVPYTQFVFEEM